MHVHSLSLPSPRIFEKCETYQSIFTIGLSKHFEKKRYGDAVNEIHYLEILVPDETMPEPHDEKVKYIYKDKKIVCIVQPEYKKIVAVSLKKYGALLASSYLEMTESFASLKIDNFDVKQFKIDLIDFFILKKLA